jgi:hypothetical protein
MKIVDRATAPHHFTIVVSLLLILISSCTRDHTALPQLCSFPTPVSFSQNILPVFNQQCARSDCHGGAYAQANLNLEPAVAYAQLTQTNKGYIDTVNADFSVLYGSMNSSSTPMPPTGKLEKCSIDLVLQWIKEGAKNN